MNYTLNQGAAAEKISFRDAVKKLWPLIASEKKIMGLALVALLINSFLNLFAPRLIAHAIDTFIPAKDYHGVLVFSGYIFLMYAVGLVTSYAQTRLMGGVGQRVLFSLRNAVFTKLQELPVAFFNQNKAGDLISRINNDTNNINQFFSQSLIQFMGSIFLMAGAALFLLGINLRLGIASLLPALVLLAVTRLLSSWVKRKNMASMQALGGMSSEVQESLSNFKVIIAFNRRDYFRERFQQVSEKNYTASIGAGVANNTLIPIYGLASNFGQIIVLAYGIYLISIGNFTIGLLISFLLYVNNFYNPLRQLAALWASFQTAMASWDRVHEILSLDTNLAIIPAPEHAGTHTSLLEFQDVTFTYPDGKEVLHHISLTLEQGKKYALVGPTGGGKTTTASLMARLYDPTSGTVLLSGRDIKSYEAGQRTAKIGFILQDPFLFSGTVRDNILYGDSKYQEHSNETLEAVLQEKGLYELLVRFEKGLATPVTSTGDGMSLGQKQLLAFIRAVLRNPELLILDEATANIDTVTEKLLEDVLQQLPSSTTQVIIAHRLNTIANADEIYFVNAGEVTQAGSMEHAVDMLMHGKRES